ncbi:MAG: hypothetical protein IT463_06410 [Planctomycetes bacterium]|nr:hypothetical protein [Planctomycetota bacterium]
MALLAALSLGAGGTLRAQETAEQGDARRIVDQPPYRGYRVEKRPAPVPPENGEFEPGGGSGDGQQGPSHGYQRGGGAAGPRSDPEIDGPEFDGGGGSGAAWNAPAWLGAAMEVLIWAVLGVAVLVGLFLVIKALLGIKWSRKAKSAKAKAAKKAVQGQAAPVEETPELELGPEFEDALVAARADLEKALAAGDYARAALLRWRIFWLEAGWRACVEEAEVRTWRDALALLRETELRIRMRGLLRTIENVRYGKHLPAAHEFETFRAELDHIPTRGVLQ